jgi:hypothetical protein
MIWSKPMIKYICGSFIIITLFVNIIAAQEKKSGDSAKTDRPDKTLLVSEELNAEGQKLDEEIDSTYKKVNNVIVNYKLSQLKDIKMLPYRTVYNVKENYIEVEKYDLVKDAFYDEKYTGINKKIIKIFLSGNTISRVESELLEQKVGGAYVDRVIIIDPSPMTPGTDDILFTQIQKNVKIIENKKLGEIKNNRASPIRNDIKKEFIIPHIIFLYDVLFDIAETYYKGIKDADRMLSDFLKKSTKY